MVKHPACAAAISSSGFVPLPCSNRVWNEYGVPDNTPLAVEIVPLPSFRPPCQCAVALRVIDPYPMLRDAHVFQLNFQIAPSDMIRIHGTQPAGRLPCMKPV